MTTPESEEVIIQRIANDARVVGFLHRVMVMGDPVFVEDEYALAAEIVRDYGVGLAAVSQASDLARGEVDAAILNGTLRVVD